MPQSLAFVQAEAAIVWADRSQRVLHLPSRAVGRAWVDGDDASLSRRQVAAEIKLRAERRAGELLNKSEVKPGNPQWSHDETIGTLSDIGITKNQSSRWQKIATIPKPLFEAFIKDTKAAEKELTTAGVLEN